MPNSLLVFIGIICVLLIFNKLIFIFFCFVFSLKLSHSIIHFFQLEQIILKLNTRLKPRILNLTTRIIHQNKIYLRFE